MKCAAAGSYSLRNARSRFDQTARTIFVVVPWCGLRLAFVPGSERRDASFEPVLQERSVKHGVIADLANMMNPVEAAIGIRRGTLEPARLARHGTEEAGDQAGLEIALAQNGALPGQALSPHHCPGLNQLRLIAESASANWVDGDGFGFAFGSVPKGDE